MFIPLSSTNFNYIQKFLIYNSHPRQTTSIHAFIFKLYSNSLIQIVLYSNHVYNIT
jgi:hypothetical protein